MDDERRIDPNHDQIRGFLRVVGPATLGVGLAFAAVGFVSFFRSFGSFEPPRYFWCAFVGLPLVGTGLWLCQLGYLGAVGRYLLGEMAPVQKDAFNVVAQGARPGVESLARAVGRGFAAAAGAAEGQRCPQCEAPREPSARFCGQCGGSFEKRVCPACDQGNPPDNHFCGHCGERLE